MYFIHLQISKLVKSSQHLYFQQQ